MPDNESWSTIDGRFEILSRLGEGGMGTVYRALHRDMDREVAIKLLKTSLTAGPEQTQRFRNEAQLISALNHPNIVSVYSIGVAETGAPYIAMELLDGKPLSELIKHCERRSYRELIPLFIQACAAIEHAHERGIIHRDIKPSNLIVLDTGGDSNAQIKVVDFGIAKALEADDITQTQLVVGSVFYLSPGQCEGRGPDVQSDIYALGCSMFEALSGRPPFVGDIYFDTMQLHRTRMAPKVKDINPQSDIPDTLEQIVACCLSKSLSTRYACVADLRKDLAGVLAGKSPTHIPSPEREFSSRTSSFHKRRLVTVFGAILLAATAAASFTRLHSTTHSTTENFVDKQGEKIQLRREFGRAFHDLSNQDFKSAQVVFGEGLEKAKQLKDPLLICQAATGIRLVYDLRAASEKIPVAEKTKLQAQTEKILEDGIRQLHVACDAKQIADTPAAFDQLMYSQSTLSTAYRDPVRPDLERQSLESVISYYPRSTKQETVTYLAMNSIGSLVRAGIEQGRTEDVVKNAKRYIAFTSQCGQTKKKTQAAIDDFIQSADHFKQPQLARQLRTLKNQVPEDVLDK